MAESTACVGCGAQATEPKDGDAKYCLGCWGLRCSQLDEEGKRFNLRRVERTAAAEKWSIGHPKSLSDGLGKYVGTVFAAVGFPETLSLFVYLESDFNWDEPCSVTLPNCTETDQTQLEALTARLLSFFERCFNSCRYLMEVNFVSRRQAFTQVGEF